MSRSHRSGGSSGGSSRSSSSFGGSSRSHLRSSHSSSRISHHDSHPLSHRSGGIHIHTHSGYGHIHNINISPFAGKCFSFIFILITLSIFLFAMISGSASFKDDLYDIEQSYNKYQNLITYSETHSSYQTTAIIDNILYDYDYDKYYIVYTFSNPSGYPSLTHESFAMYSSVEAMNLHKGDEIIVALDTPKNDISHNTDSINIDY